MRVEFEDKLRTAQNKDPAFLTDGYCNLKKALERFREHQTSACHMLVEDPIIILPKDLCKILGQLYLMFIKRSCKKLTKDLGKSFLARQGIAFKGDTDENSNLIQLFKLRANDDASMHDCLKRHDKYNIFPMIYKMR